MIKALQALALPLGYAAARRQTVRTGPFPVNLLWCHTFSLFVTASSPPRRNLSNMLTAVAILACLTALVGLGLWMRERQRRHALESKLETTQEELDEVRREARSRIGRAEREAKRREKDATWEAIETLLPAVDALESAVRQRREEASESGQASSDSSESLGEGISLTLDQFETGLETLGIERLTPSSGDAFDPDWHEALHIREPDDAEPDDPSENREGAWKIRECVRSGYRTDERVLRPAGVVVEQAAGGEEASDEPTPDEEVTLEGEPSDAEEDEQEESAERAAAPKTQS